MINIVNKLADRMLDVVLPKAVAAASDCICCPGGGKSYYCEYGDLYELSCCCNWRLVCGGCC